MEAEEGQHLKQMQALCDIHLLESKDCAVVNSFLSSEDGLVCIWTIVLVQDKFELQVTVNRSNNTHESGLFQCKRHLMSLVVPQVIDSEALSIVEVPL